MKNAKKFLVILIFGTFLTCLYAQEFSPDSPDDDRLAEESDVSAKDVALAAGLAFTVNVFFNSADRIILNKDYAAVNTNTIKRNLTGSWWWDVDGFATNQFGHPYQGSLYFNAGRANGLNFWASLSIAAFGSLTWEEFGETDAPSINDIITTPICGAVFGETFHRLYLDADEICPALAWLLSPIDAFSSLMSGKKAEVSGHTEEISISFHGGSEYSNTDFSSSSKSDKMSKAAGGSAIHVQYGDEAAHESKEPFDLFTLDCDTGFSVNFYKADFCIDGFLWSKALYFDESEGTFGIDLIYEGEFASNSLFSNAATGVKYIHTRKFSDSDGKFTFFAQADGIFMGTRSVHSLYKNRSDYDDWIEPPRFYNFGYGALAKFGFSVGNTRFGKFFAESEASFLLPFSGSDKNTLKSKNHTMASVKMGYEHKITGSFSLGISDCLTYKADRYKHEADTVQVLDSASIYGKFSFERK